MKYELIKTRDNNIIQKYLIEQKSTKELGGEFNTSYKNVLRILHKYKTPIRETRNGIKNLNLKGAKRGKLHPNWKGGRHVNQGYVWILNPKREGQKKMYVKEHRYLMEQLLGRELLKTELVHHKNGIRNDNRLENLRLLAFTNHYGEVCCPYCQKAFLIK